MCPVGQLFFHRGKETFGPGIVTWHSYARKALSHPIPTQRIFHRIRCVLAANYYRQLPGCKAEGFLDTRSFDDLLRMYLHDNVHGYILKNFLWLALVPEWWLSFPGTLALTYRNGGLILSYPWSYPTVIHIRTVLFSFINHDSILS
jgi:hypothetical protein